MAVIAALVLVALWWPRGTETSPSPEDTPVTQAPAPADAPPRRAPPTPPPAMSMAVAVAELPPSSEPEIPGTTPAKPPDAPPIELPPTTQALAEEFFPGTTDWEAVPVDESQQYQLRILPQRYNVVAPMPIALLLEITDRQGNRQPLTHPRVRVRALEDETRPWIDVPVKDDGKGADEQAGDLRYTATLQPNREQKKQLLGHVLVEGSVDVPSVGTRTIPAVLLYTVGPRAKLTGRWSDSLRNGSLVLEPELEVEEPGLFTLMAQVFGPQLEPLAWVKQTQKLGAGRRTMTLEVFGKVLHDAGVDGPYRVRQVLLSRDHENSSAYDPGVTLEEAHQTKPYRASEFSPAAYVPPPRTVEEVTAEHPSQREKPPPERSRDMAPASGTEPPPPPAPGDAPPQQATSLGH
ncbi:hypothetical protein [Archangium sp.]|uniref:hypothetical protein n=1 Tax=Archangium sp. TaxID=1872627 RepID=UPI002ED98421